MTPPPLRARTAAALALSAICGSCASWAGPADSALCGRPPGRDPAENQAPTKEISPFEEGPYAVECTILSERDFEAPVPTRIHVPQGGGPFPVVVFQHGFMTLNSAYDQILSRVASHGFVVAAPQMYPPGIRALSGDPTAEEEAALALEHIDWLQEILPELAPQADVVSPVGIAGHSRGGKVAWFLATDHPERFAGIAGVDPVDGRGGPRGNQPRVLDREFAYAFPSLVLGAGLSGSCAPEGENHVQFFHAVPVPAWHAVAADYGHGDMLDPLFAQLASGVCRSGRNPADMRRFTAGILVAFFSAALRDDDTMLEAIIIAPPDFIDLDIETRLGDG